MSHDDFDAPETTGSENATPAAAPSPLDPQPEPTTPSTSSTPVSTEIDDDFGLPKSKTAKAAEAAAAEAARLAAQKEFEANQRAAAAAADTTPDEDSSTSSTSDLAAGLVGDLDDETIAAQAEAAAAAFATKEPIWEPRDYAAAGVAGESAKKLSESFIAPLVAAARGYRSFDEDTIGEISSAFRLVDKRSRQHRRVVEAAGRKDVMLMPWYSVSRIKEHAMSTAQEADSIQFRPGILPPLAEGEKKGRKYEFLTGEDTPISVHPSFPTTWVSDCPKVLLAEGLLKGDAALTGMLLDAGISREDLAFHGTPNPRGTLRGLIERVPEHKQVVIFTMAGVWNWKKNPEWTAIALKGREIWLGIDGDVAVNPKVYSATDQLWDYAKNNRKAEKICLLSPAVPTGMNGMEDVDDDKLGIDDYLAFYGTWQTMLACLSDEMPPKPADLHASEGDVRVSPNGCQVERYEITQRDANGNPLNGAWKVAFPIGGRILSTMEERVPSDREIETGNVGQGVDAAGSEWEVEVEISFMTEMSKIEHHTIVGPNRIMNYLPEQWESKGAQIPGPVLNHEEWPPRGKDAGDWVKAIKKCRKGEIASRVRWDTMGWVPVPGSIPAYIVGETVIGGDNLETNDEVIPGVVGRALNRASGFGVGFDSGQTFDSDEYRDEVKRAIEAMLRVYVLDEPWTDRRNAAVVVAAGLRPALPIRPKCIIYFTGARGKGKSFSAEAIMSFWHASPGSLNPIPGTAKDTAAAMELAVSRANIWTIDDVAPANSRRQNDDEKDKIGNLIRAVFNGSAKSRSNANMETRKQHDPRAMLVITAENEPTVSSERDRILLCDIGHGSLSKSYAPTNALIDMTQAGRGPEAGAPALVSQALVKFLRWEAQKQSWSWVYSQVQDSLDSAMAFCDAEMTNTGCSRRHMETASHLMISYTWLHKMATEVGVERKYLALLSRTKGLPKDIIDHVIHGVAQNKETSPGRALVESLASVLRRGRGHILNSDDPTRPPLNPVNDAARLAALGWRPSGGPSNEWRPVPGSDSIGFLVQEGNDQVILFDVRTAFAVAKDNSNGLIPEGQGPRSSWSAVSGEDFGYAKMLRSDSKGKTINSARKMSNGVSRSGYPIELNQAILGGVKPDEDPEAVGIVREDEPDAF